MVAAIDINTTANQIYKHNFPDTALWNKTIEVGDGGEFSVSVDLATLAVKLPSHVL